MRYLTIEQRESLQQWLKTRAALLRREIADALRHSDEVERDVRELREVERGLERLHEPEYGVCADCGVDIPFSRLSATPVATRCTGCQARAERALTEPAHPA